MIFLHNRTNNQQLRERLHSNSNIEKRITLSFYAYHPIDDVHAFRDQLYIHLDAMKVQGRIYVAQEGINAQISVPEHCFSDFKQYIHHISFLRKIKLNIAVESSGKSFFKLKIIARKKIVEDGLGEVTLDIMDSKKKIDASSFNKMTDDDSMLVVDVRNGYESEVGHFKNALLPRETTFRDTIPVLEKMLKKNKTQPIILYCTGGIRCEKVASWLHHQGFSNVFQLEGGIIQYARQVKKLDLENKFIGKNFVFDERLGERISPDVISSCHQCDDACDIHTNCKNTFCNLLFIQCKTCKKEYDGCCSASCKHISELPKIEQKEIYKSAPRVSGRKIAYEKLTK